MSSESNESSHDHPAPVVVATYAHLGEAEVALAHLRSADIEAELDNDTEGGVMPLGGQDGIKVLVQPDDVDVAKAVLKPVDSD